MDQEQIRQWLRRLNTQEALPDDFESAILLSTDADRVLDYVFESPGLSEMRGASEQLKELNDVSFVSSLLASPEIALPPQSLIYTGGGSIIVLAPRSSRPAIETLKRELERHYPEETGAATVTCVLMEASPEKVQQDFGELVSEAGIKLRLAKAQQQQRPNFEVLPFTRRCDACRKRPAVMLVHPYEDQPPEGRCRVCVEKWRKGRDARSAWHERQAPQDLEEIGGASQGAIGVIYADGNGVGDWIQGATTIAEFRQRSDLVATAMKRALKTALRTWAAQLPFEVILVGGDDVLLIVPASIALWVARDLCATFESEMQKYAKTMSAGVAFADHHTPVYFLRRLVNKLLKETKRHQTGSAVDFLVLKSQGTRTIDEAWETYTFPDTGEQLILHGGPYALPELDKLLERIQEGKGKNYPRSQLYGLRETFKQGRQASALAFLYQKARSKQEYKAFLSRFADDWCQSERETAPWFLSHTLRGGIKVYCTAWADMADLWDWIG